MTEQKTKVPAQFFQWFESLKQGYENSINKLFNRVEKVNEDHKKQIKTVYQSQIDDLKKSYQEHLQSLKSNYQQQTEQSQKRIKQLENDAQFYQQQFKRQNQTIDKLNDRYDAVIFALKDKMDHKELANVIKDISPQSAPSLPATKSEESDGENHQPFDHSAQSTATTPSTAEPSQDSQVSDNMQSPATNELDKTPHSNEAQLKQDSAIDNKKVAEQTSEQVNELVNLAFTARKDQRFEQAYELFYSAAMSGDAKAMGAIGRAHFVGEGVNTDKSLGLAWLILAANNQFEPAMKKVHSAQTKSPELYAKALELSEQLINRPE